MRLAFKACYKIRDDDRIAIRFIIAETYTDALRQYREINDDPFDKRLLALYETDWSGEDGREE